MMLLCKAVPFRDISTGKSGKIRLEAVCKPSLRRGSAADKCIALELAIDLVAIYVSAFVEDGILDRLSDIINISMYYYFICLFSERFFILLLLIYI